MCTDWLRFYNSIEIQNFDKLLRHNDSVGKENLHFEKQVTF